MLATAGLGIALAVWPGGRELAVDVYLLAVGALALAAVVDRTIGAQPKERPTRLDRRRPPPRPDPRPRELLKLEREVALAGETAFDAYFRLRPHVRALAAVRLAARGVELDAADGAAEELLGPEAWAIAEPDLPRPRDHAAPGLALAEIDAAVAALERL